MQAAQALALCLLACTVPALCGRGVLQDDPDVASQHTAPTVMSLTALAASGRLSLAVPEEAPVPLAATAPTRPDKKPPVHRTMGTLTPAKMALAFVPDNRPGVEEEDEHEHGAEGPGAEAPTSAATFVGAAAVAGQGSPDARRLALGGGQPATVSAHPGHVRRADSVRTAVRARPQGGDAGAEALAPAPVAAGARPGRSGHASGVETAARVRLRSGNALSAEAPAPRLGANTAALIGMGSAFGVLGGSVGPSFSFGGENVSPAVRGTPDMRYHGGTIITQPVNIYLVMYGTWDASVPTGLASFLNALSGTAWMQINAAYTDSRGGRGTSTMRHSGTCYDTGTRGASLSDADVLAVIQGCLTAGVLPRDPLGLYYLISSPEVAQKGFCTDYCGWHDVGPNNLLYGFVGSTLRCPTTCQVQAVGPNGASALDGVASILAHEIAETITDPYTDAWYDSAGEEGADKCAWRYGASWQAPNGAKANTVLSNGNTYLLQMNWNPNGGGCTQGYAASSRRR